MVQGGLKAIYLSGWQVAGDGNLSGKTYPDQSLYPSNSVPNLVRRINNALLRADQIQHLNEAEDNKIIDWLAPIVADGEAGFGGPLNVFELTKEMIEARERPQSTMRMSFPRRKSVDTWEERS